MTANTLIFHKIVLLVIETVGFFSRKMNGDKDYFDSYDDLEVHRLMLCDSPRTESYRDAILKNQEFFAGKVIMDVGAGSGILSLFCKRAGAKKVYAVEASPLAKILKDVIRVNQAEDVIEV